MKLLKKLLFVRAAAVIMMMTALAFLVMPAQPTSAVVAGSPCAGNVCTGSITIGGQAVQYSYTQHLSASGEFRIRFNGGLYNTTSLVSFILSNMPAFTSTGYLVNPSNGAKTMTEVNVNPGNTAYERLSSTGCQAYGGSCIFDHVMSVQYTGLAAGVYTFNFTILQNNSSGGMVAVPFYVDTGAPTNGNESVTWTASGLPVVPNMDYPCADGIDEDLDFKTDCADAQCVGKVGKVVSGALCQAAETTCNDGFDNDGDGLADCLDSDCGGRVGQPFGAALCQYGNEKGAATCVDGFDNDGDGLTDCYDNVSSPAGVPSNTCWKQAAYGCPATETSCTDNIDNDKDASYSSAWDGPPSGPSTGVDCQDYDCVGNIACPAAENKDKNGASHDEQCFNGIDDDLDTKIDCADPQCANVINPGNPAQACYLKEFDLAQHYQFCANGFDDNGNGASDCSDLSCKQQFGNCGPCPTREDLTWSACADGVDNDTDAQTDCADTANCNAKVGSTTLGAICSTLENTDRACSDGFDNDLDGKIDCADSTCAGRKGPGGVTCQSPAETTCSDGLDSDGDGLIDCADPSCAGVGSCAAASWTQAPACQVVPLYSGQTAFTSVSPTITATVRLTTHVNDVDTIRLTGTGTYSSVTVVIGDNTAPASYYPYAAASPNCKLTGTNASLFNFVVANNHAIEIYDTGSAATFGAFDITLTCNTPATPASQISYPISLSALKQPGDVQEYGDVAFSTTLLEATPPTMTEIEGEGVVGTTITVPYGGVSNPATRRFRGVPNDPNPYSSGICRCDLDVSGTAFPGAADCITTPIVFLSDVSSLVVKGRAEDGAGNLGAYGPNATFTVNVTPVNNTPLVLLPSTPFFKSGSMDVGRLTAGYITGGTDSFSSVCGVYLYNDSGSLINGPIGPTYTFPGAAAGNTLLCDITNSTLPAGLADGRYFAKVRATDSDSNFADSNPQVLYVCNTVPGPTDPEPTNGCQYADFDHDNASEGLFTSMYSTDKIACDNCVNLSNPTQSDKDANGIGDVCEPTNQYGRCEVDTDIICLYDSDNPVHCVPGSEDPLCCPGPSIKNDPSTGVPKNPQQCKLTWGTCTVGGDVCFSNAQCPGGPGKCQDGSTSCYVDADCGALPGTALCTGADACDDKLYPWIQTVYGNVFTKKKIDVPDVPPKNLFNATYCVTAKETIVNFTTEGRGSCAAITDATARPDFPQSGNRYTTVLGSLDITGLRNGKYGTVTTVTGGQLDSTLSLSSDRLGGRVIRVVGDATINVAHVISNDPVKGSGTIFIDGGDLYINADVSYDALNTVDDLKKLASLGWMVVANGSTGGNIYVDKSVTTLAGAFYLNGSAGFNSVAPPEINSITPLTVYGLVIAHEFHLNRVFKSMTDGAERFIYDGRAVANPPPGFTDVTKALPTLTDTPGP